MQMQIGVSSRWLLCFQSDKADTLLYTNNSVTRTFSYPDLETVLIIVPRTTSDKICERDAGLFDYISVQFIVQAFCVFNLILALQDNARFKQ